MSTKQEAFNAAIRVIQQALREKVVVTDGYNNPTVNMLTITESRAIRLAYTNHPGEDISLVLCDNERVKIVEEAAVITKELEAVTKEYQRALDEHKRAGDRLHDQAIKKNQLEAKLSEVRRNG